MKNTNPIEKTARDYFAQNSAEGRTTRELDERILGAALVAQEQAKARSTRRQLIGNPVLRWAVVPSLAVVILLAFLLIPQSATRVWAIEEVVQALEKYTAVHITGYTTVSGHPALAEIWARANAAATRSEKCLVKSDAFVAWVSDNKTFIYDRAQNTVLIDPAITVGLNPWLGPNFLKTLAKLPDCRMVVGDDLATGQKRLILTASLESSAGPQSFYIEFDSNTKLPVSMKHWSNRKRQGVPDFSLDKIVYFESLPDSTFAFIVPTSARFTAKPLTIPEANLRLLSDPKSGIPAAGLTRDQACQRILTQLWSAVIDGDFARLRQLCPITASWPDALLRELGTQDDPVELLQVGAIEHEGQSPLGPIALVPSQVRCRDGKVREVKMVVQFRQTENGVSCVINGSYGYSVEVGEP